MISLNYYAADPEREKNFLIKEENGIYYLVFNPRAYDYVYRNCYVCIQRGKDFRCTDLMLDIYRALEGIGALKNDTSDIPEESRVYVTGGNANLEPLPEKVAGYALKLGLKIYQITSSRNALIIHVFKDSSMEIPGDFVAMLEKLPPNAMNRKVVVVVHPVTEEQGRKGIEVMSRIYREAVNGSLRSFCVVTSMLHVSQLVNVYVDGKCLIEKNLSEKQVIDKIRDSLADESYPLEIFIDYDFSPEKMRIVPLEPKPADDYRKKAIFILILLSLVAIVMLRRIRR
jgi:hypothetical protein